MTDLQKAQQKTLARYEASFFDFCEDSLGYHDMNAEHRALCEFINGPTDPGKRIHYKRNKKLFNLILMPRYTFKSCVATVGYSLYRLLFDPNIRILIYSDATSKAQGFLTSVKNHIMGKVDNSKFRAQWGEWETDPKKGKWNESAIIVKTRSTASAEPSIETAGIETSLVGRHYDLIIFDDIVSDKNVTTKEQMDKTSECYSKALSLLRPGGEVLMVGTRWHFGDLYGRIIAENKHRQTFGIFHRKAEIDGKLLFADIGENSLTRSFLEQQRLQQGSYIFSCLYLNEPTDDETRVFKTTDFAFYGSIKPDDLYITATCDPAGQGEDFTAITVVGTDTNMDMHILEIVNKHLQPSEIIEKIINLNYKYKFKMFGLEKTFFRGMLRLELERRIKEERQNDKFRLFGIHEFEPSGRKGEGKANRIMALQPYHERGALKFPGEKVELLKDAFSDLAYQMIQFPNAAHDDILDSLAYHLPLIRKGGVVKKQEVPKFTPVWLEQRWFEEKRITNSRLPRRLRKPLGEMAFS